MVGKQPQRGNFNIPLSSLNISPPNYISGEKLQNETSTDQLNLIAVYRLLHLTGTSYTFFSRVRGTCCKTDHIMCHMASLNKHRRIKVIYLSWKEIIVE